MAKKPKVLPSIEWLEPRVRLMRVLSLVCFFGLIGLFIGPVVLAVTWTLLQAWIADALGADEEEGASAADPQAQPLGDTTAVRPAELLTAGAAETAEEISSVAAEPGPVVVEKD